MKHSIKALLIAAFVVSAVSLLSSCEALLDMLLGSGPVSITERIELFEADLNAVDRSGIRSNFHPDMQNYDQLNDPAVLDAGPLSSSNAPFTIGTPAISGTSATCTLTHRSGGAEGTISFVMKLDGEDYKILSLNLSFGDQDYELKRIPAAS